MVQAAKKAKRATNDTERKGYQAFLFMEANSLLHQMGHTFITYLSGGGANGPPITTATEAWDPSPIAGVVGYTLEALLFGGTIEYWVDLDHGTSFDEVRSHIVTAAQGRPLRSKLMHTPVRRALPDRYNQPLENFAGDNREDYQLR